MWSCPGSMPKYYPGLRDILPDRELPRSERHITPTVNYPDLRDILPDRRGG